MLQIVLIVAVAWLALSLLATPFVALLGRAGRRADLDAHRHHQELLACCEHAAAVSERRSPAHAAHG